METTKKEVSPEKGNKISPDGKKDEATVEVLTSFVPALPLIDGDKIAEYEAFGLACTDALKPADAIETVWLRDFIDYEWEALRLKKMKAATIQLERQGAVQRLIGLYSDQGVSALDLIAWQRIGQRGKVRLSIM